MITLSRREIIAWTGATGLGMSSVSSLAAMTSAIAPSDQAPWDLTDLYPNSAAWESERRALASDLPQLTRFKGSLGASAGALRQALEAISDATRRVNRLIAYAYLKADEDVRIAPNQERKQQSEDLFSALNQSISWLKPEVLAIGADQIRRFISAEPRLARFRFQLENMLRQAPHTLSQEGEQLLAAASAPLTGPSIIREQLTSADIPRPTITLSTGEKLRLDDQGYAQGRQATNRVDRKLVFDSFWQSYKAFEGTLGATLAAKVEGDQFRSKARRYKSALEMTLAADNIPTDVYKSLMAEAGRGVPVLQRYVELRRRMLALPDIGYWDMSAPLLKADRKFPLRDMRKIVLEAMQPLGSEYVRALSAGTAARWMDPLPRPGKAGGGYTQPGARDVHPYVFLNLTEDYTGLTNYAHEWGHVVHTMLAKTAQPYETVLSSVFIDEMAALCAEQLLASHLLRTAKSREDKLFYLGQQMERFRIVFFRPAMNAEFELAIHDRADAGEGLSGEKFSEIYGELLRKYYGDSLTVKPSYSMEWAYIPHFYGDFYVFQYATAISGAVYFAQSLLKGGEAERDRYIAMLKAGGSDYPVETLKRAGLDMTSPAPYRALIDQFSRVLDEAEALV